MFCSGCLVSGTDTSFLISLLSETFSSGIIFSSLDSILIGSVFLIAVGIMLLSFLSCFFSTDTTFWFTAGFVSETFLV